MCPARYCCLTKSISKQPIASNCVRDSRSNSSSFKLHRISQSKSRKLTSSEQLDSNSNKKFEKLLSQANNNINNNNSNNNSSRFQHLDRLGKIIGETKLQQFIDHSNQQQRAIFATFSYHYTTTTLLTTTAKSIENISLSLLINRRSTETQTTNRRKRKKRRKLEDLFVVDGR